MRIILKYHRHGNNSLVLISLNPHRPFHDASSLIQALLNDRNELEWNKGRRLIQWSTVRLYAWFFLISFWRLGGQRGVLKNGHYYPELNNRFLSLGNVYHVRNHCNWFLKYQGFDYPVWFLINQRFQSRLNSHWFDRNLIPLIRFRSLNVNWNQRELY